MRASGRAPNLEMLHEYLHFVLLMCRAKKMPLKEVGTLLITAAGPRNLDILYEKIFICLVGM